MHYYFLSNFSAVIKIDGVYLGALGKSAKTFECDKNSVPLVEVTSLSFPCTTYAFLLNEKFLTTPNDHVSVTDLKGGYFIKFLLPASTDFSVIKQEKFTGLTATIFNQNGLKLSIETEKDFYYENLDFSFESASVFPVKLFGNAFLGIEFVGDKKRLLLYKIADCVQKKFSAEVDDFNFDNGFYTKYCLKDIAKHIVEIHWQFTNDEFCEGQKTITQSQNFHVENLPKEVLPYAFLEELLIGGKIDEYLAQNILSKADRLKGYFGEFLGVCPPPSFRKQNEVGLIYTKKNNIFEVNYFTFEFEKDKICNVKRSDD